MCVELARLKFALQRITASSYALACFLYGYSIDVLVLASNLSVADDVCAVYNPGDFV